MNDLPHFCDEWQTLDRLAQGCSIARFGDGEFDMVRTRASIYFQGWDQDLQQRLREILARPIDGLLVGIPNILEGSRHLNGEWVNLAQWGTIRAQMLPLLPAGRTWYSSFITRPEAVRGL